MRANSVVVSDAIRSALAAPKRSAPHHERYASSGEIMRCLIGHTVLALFPALLLGCASSIVDGEGVRTSTEVIAPKPRDAAIELYFSGKAPERQVKEIGRVRARAWVLEKGLNVFKDNARELGADAITNIKYERRFSADYLQDLYFIDGDAVVWR